ncbi:hypothetical protein AVEN_37497-1, partial [Araneus ventricosus]
MDGTLFLGKPYSTKSGVMPMRQSVVKVTRAGTYFWHSEENVSSNWHARVTVFPKG